MSWRDASGAAKAAAIFATLSLVVSFSTTNTSSINGVRSCSFTDYGAVGFGAVAVIAGLFALLRAGDGSTRGLNLTVGAATVLVGLWRVSYGLGLVGGPC